MSGVGEGICVCVDDLALNLIGPAAVVSKASSDIGNIDLCHSKGLSVVERLNRREKIEILLDQFRELDEEPATLLWRLLPPYCLVALAGSSYGDINILLRGFGDGTDDFFGTGVESLEGLSVDALNPLVVNEPEGLVGVGKGERAKRHQNGVRDLQSGGLSVLASRWRGELNGSHVERCLVQFVCFVLFCLLFVGYLKVMFWCTEVK